MHHRHEPVIFHLDRFECAALDRGNATEAEHIEREAIKVARRLRRPVNVCCDDGSSCYYTISETGERLPIPHEKAPPPALEECPACEGDRKHFPTCDLCNSTGQVTPETAKRAALRLVNEMDRPAMPLHKVAISPEHLREIEAIESILAHDGIHVDPLTRSAPADVWRTLFDFYSAIDHSDLPERSREIRRNRIADLRAAIWGGAFGHKPNAEVRPKR